MNGLYIHIPFCTKICGYCDFATVAGSARLFGEYVDLLLREAERRFGENPHFIRHLETAYFGGGTPSVLPPREFERLGLGVESLGVDFRQLQEVDWECNPDSATDENLQAAISLGVNRISLGVQTFDNELLKAIGRRGTAEQARDALRRILRLPDLSGKKIRSSADLMFWLPGQTLAGFERDVRELAETGIGHVSFYGLTLNPRTVLGMRFEQGKISLDEGLYARMYRSGVQILQDYGLERYEVSNFAKWGEESLHNRNYWRRGEYLGLGPGAHSFRGNQRLAAPSRYLEWKNWVLAGCLESKMEIDRLGKKERLCEKIWLSLRTREGLDLQTLDSEEVTQISCRKIDHWVRKGYLQKSGTKISLCGDGWLWMDSVVEDLIP